MKTGTWYVCGFVIAFVYFYVYAVNYVRGVKGDDSVVGLGPEGSSLYEKVMPDLYKRSGRQFKGQSSFKRRQSNSFPQQQQRALQPR